MKNAIITGGSSGIGLAAAKQLLEKGYRVIIAGRSQSKLDKAIASLKEATGSEEVSAYSVDLSDFESVRRFAEELKVTMPVIDILALNAGIYTGVKYRRGVSGYEMMISATHLGHFLLTHLLMPNIEVSEQPRIVVTSSEAHKIAGLEISSFTKPKYAFLPFLGTLWGYGQAKLANILYTRELARRLGDSKIKVNCFHPGAVDTGFTRHIPNFIAIPVKRFLISSELAATTLVYLADSLEAGKTTGEYFINKRVRNTTAKGKSEELAKELWLESERILGL